MKLWGYVLRPDGDYEKRCEFLNRRPDKRVPYCIETLVRNPSGKLLRVERTSKALKLAAWRATKGT